MKSVNFKLVLAILTVTIFLSTSCKKESTPAPKTTQEKIVGKWQLKSSEFNHFYSGLPHIVTITGTTADYADFRNDNKVYSYINGTYDTASYGIVTFSKIWIDASNHIFDIQILTDTDLKIYNKESYPAGEYDESTLIFFR